MGKIFKSSLQKSATKAFVHYAKATKGVYLGPVNPRNVEQHLVRGFTTTNTHRDTDHCVGQHLHHDYVLLRRQDGKRQYIIAEVDLHLLHSLHHFFVVPNELAEDLFTLLLASHLHHRYVPFSPYDGFIPRFKQRYSLLSRPEHFQSSMQAVQGEMARCLAELKQRFILEVTDTSLFVYDLDTQAPTPKSLDTHIRFACALATLLEKREI